MTWYSEIPARRTRQIAGDVWLVAWSALWIWAAVRLYDLVMNLAAPGLAVSSSATDLADRFDDAGAAVGQVPLDGLLGRKGGAGHAGETHDLHTQL